MKKLLIALSLFTSAALAMDGEHNLNKIDSKTNTEYLFKIATNTDSMPRTIRGFRLLGANF